jgi:hypothetical protein
VAVSRATSRALTVSRMRFTKYSAGGAPGACAVPAPPDPLFRMDGGTLERRFAPRAISVRGLGDVRAACGRVKRLSPIARPA